MFRAATNLVKERPSGNPHHRNRFSHFKAKCFEIRSAAVPLPQRGGSFAHPVCLCTRFNESVLIYPSCTILTLRLSDTKPPRCGRGTAAIIETNSMSFNGAVAVVGVPIRTLFHQDQNVERRKKSRQQAAFYYESLTRYSQNSCSSSLTFARRLGSSKIERMAWILMPGQSNGRFSTLR